MFRLCQPGQCSPDVSPAEYRAVDELLAAALQGRPIELLARRIRFRWGAIEAARGGAA